MKHPNFILGVVSLVLLFIGVGVWANGASGAYYVWIAAILLGGIHWIWAITDVLRHYSTKADAHENINIFWVIMVIIIPPVGGMLYYATQKKIRV